MKHSITYNFHRRSRVAWAALGLAILLSLSSGVKSFAQVYANESALSGTYGCGGFLEPGCGTSNVAAAGNARDGSGADGTKATLTSTKAILGVSGGNVFMTLRFATNAPAGKTVYVRIDPPTATGLLTSVLGIVSLFQDGRVSAQLLSGATASGNGTNVPTAQTRIVTDASNNLYIAVTPTSGSAVFNAVRINVAAQALDVVSTVQLSVYNAFYYANDTDDACGLPVFASLGEVDGVLNVSLSNVVANPQNAIDNSFTTASVIGGGGVDLTALASLSQTLFFKKTSASTDQAVVYLAFQTALVDVDLLGGLQVQAFNGEQQAGPAVGLSTLISANVLNLITLNGSIPQGQVVPFYYTPTAPFDRIRISLGNTVNLSLLGTTGIQVYGAGQVTPKPTLSSSIVYQFEGATPSVTATAGAGSIYWQGPLPARANLTENPSGSPAAFPIPVNVNSSYAAVSVRSAGCANNPSDYTALQVIVLKDITTLIPLGVGSDPYSTGAAIQATSADHTVTYQAATGLPPGITFNTTTGELVPDGSLPGVTETTTYEVEVGILVDGNETGLTLKKTITVDPKLFIPGGTFPPSFVTESTYSENITASVNDNGNGAATGGRTGATLKYSLSDPSLRVAAQPNGFTLSQEGVLSGNPSSAPDGIYEFTIYVTDDFQTRQAQYFVRLINPLPVTLVSFNATAEGNTASLSWSTSEESNSDRFDIERSQNGKNWSKIGSVKSSQESKSAKYYNFTDASPVGGRNLYRLKMVDLDETFNYSQIKNVEFANTAFVSPNPVRGDEQLKITLTDWSNVKLVTVINTAGKTVFESSNALSTGISTRNLAAGAYIVKVIQNDGSVLTHRFIRQ